MEYVYDSRYTDTKVRADGYLVEVFMTRKYSKKGKVLPQKFWNVPQYKSEFFANLGTVRGIFKTYEDMGVTPKTIVAALTGNDARNITWLKDPKIDALIEAQITKEKVVETAPNIDTSDCSMCQPLKPVKKRSTLSMLRELEHGEKDGGGK